MLARTDPNQFLAAQECWVAFPSTSGEPHRLADPQRLLLSALLQITITVASSVAIDDSAAVLLHLLPARCAYDVSVDCYPVSQNVDTIVNGCFWPECTSFVV
jgi:hypothetical protein